MIRFIAVLWVLVVLALGSGCQDKSRDAVPTKPQTPPKEQPRGVDY